MMNYYVGTMLVKKGGERRYIINVTAGNLAEARTLINDLWYKYHPDAHAFRVEARRLRDDEEYLYNWFARRDYCSYENCKG